MLEKMRNSRLPPISSNHEPLQPQEHQVPPSDYPQYRRRKLWKDISARILRRDGFKCRRCGGSKNENEDSYDRDIVVHHRCYAPEVMNGLADEWLVSLCHGCHNLVHFDESGVRRSPAEAERVLSTPDMSVDFPEPVVDLRRWKIYYAEWPKEWERMNINQRRGWKQRRDELVAEKRRTRIP